jgi:hypothetical protein
MSEPVTQDSLRAHREAVRRRVCALCLDGLDDGRCGLDSVACAIHEHLPRLVETILAVHDRRDDAYASAVEAHVCGRCTHRDERGTCQLRRDGRCAIALYLPLIVEAIEEVESRRRADTA